MSPGKKPRITLLNGSLGGSSGNTWGALSNLVEILRSRAELEVVHLADGVPGPNLEARLRESDGFVFATGTYWDSWGSPLQKFFEDATEFEAGDLWLGKPAAVVVTMHSVGGKEVLSRMQGVLCTLGLSLPPMSGMAYSLAGHLALRGEDSGFHADLWQLEDLKTVGHNLLEAIEGGKRWKTWPVDSQDPRRRWI